ncbi:unnamed protein product [Rotaria sp. Silwood2]|nr:unnamed protein product [Rotaria sp. Silwood2]CAF3108135.1 unnamed protein product [Rotaria sp. Silwood2]CAF3885284.1 unnamed protein product [Rotaria sp. Silwood2]CAF3974003.1 unnamed protein product [Rotaria sp. Silwood2]
MLGPLDSPYENRILQFKLEFPVKHPFVPLKIQFNTEIFHSNIFLSGEICLNLLQEEWAPSCTLSTALISIQSVVNDPNPNDPSNQETAHYYRFNCEKYSQIAREWTNKYATPHDMCQKIFQLKKPQEKN